MKIKAFITTYDRKRMLTKVVDHLNSHGIIPIIKDDGSTYEHDFPQYFRHEHRGKKEYWITWYEMLNDCANSEAELFLFMPDDFQELDVQRMIALHYHYNKQPYVYNIINDGRTKEWTGIEAIDYDENSFKVGFTDCGFFCNKEALRALRFTVDQVPLWRWEKYGENCSSGVGHQLSLRLTKQKVSIFMPKESLAKHGTHESKMHTEERKNNPLISR